MDKKQMPDINAIKKIKAFEDYNNLCIKEIKLLEALYKKISSNRKDIDVETEIRMVRIKKEIYNLQTEVENKRLFISRFYNHGAVKQ